RNKHMGNVRKLSFKFLFNLRVYEISFRDSQKATLVQKFRIVQFQLVQQDFVLLFYILTIARYQKKQDRKSTRLNSSHVKNSYAVFCLNKKNARALAALGVQVPRHPEDLAAHGLPALLTRRPNPARGASPAAAR